MGVRLSSASRRPSSPDVVISESCGSLGREDTCLCPTMSLTMGYNISGLLQGVGLHPKQVCRSGQEGAERKSTCSAQPKAQRGETLQEQSGVTSPACRGRMIPCADGPSMSPLLSSSSSVRRFGTAVCSRGGRKGAGSTQQGEISSPGLGQKAMNVKEQGEGNVLQPCS